VATVLPTEVYDVGMVWAQEIRALGLWKHEVEEEQGGSGGSSSGNLQSDWWMQGDATHLLTPVVQDDGCSRADDNAPVETDEAADALSLDVHLQSLSLRTKTIQEQLATVNAMARQCNSEINRLRSKIKENRKQCGALCYSVAKDLEVCRKRQRGGAQHFAKRLAERKTFQRQNETYLADWTSDAKSAYDLIQDPCKSSNVTHDIDKLQTDDEAETDTSSFSS